MDWVARAFFTGVLVDVVKFFDKFEYLILIFYVFFSKKCLFCKKLYIFAVEYCADCERDSLLT